MPDFKFDEVVIGGSYESFLYAFYNKLPLIAISEEEFYGHEYVKYSDLYFPFRKRFKRRNLFKLKNENLLCKKEQIYSTIYSYLAFNGLLIFSENAKIRKNGNLYEIVNSDKTVLTFQTKKITFIGIKTSKSKVSNRYIYVIPVYLEKTGVFEKDNTFIYALNKITIVSSSKRYDVYSLQEKILEIVGIKTEFTIYKRYQKQKVRNAGKNFLNNGKVIECLKEQISPFQLQELSSLVSKF